MSMVTLEWIMNKQIHWNGMNSNEWNNQIETNTIHLRNSWTLLTSHKPFEEVPNQTNKTHLTGFEFQLNNLSKNECKLYTQKRDLIEIIIFSYSNASYKFLLTFIYIELFIKKNIIVHCHCGKLNKVKHTIP